MKQYYECHITMDPEDKSRHFMQDAVESTGWSFSAIAGDPDLGPGLKCYATRQFNRKYELSDIIFELNAVAEKLNYTSGIRVLRRKIEIVVHDNREILE